MYKEKIELIEIILNDLSIDMIIALYEVVVNENFDYIENLFPTKEDFEEFIEKYKNDQGTLLRYMYPQNEYQNMLILQEKIKKNK